MSGAQELAKKGLDLGLAAITHTGWWLQWHTDRHACRELTELAPLQPQAASASASAERPAA
jgi:hypothetical protein